MTTTTTVAVMTSSSDTPSSSLQLTPQVLDRLRKLQESEHQVSVDEVLRAANLDHLAQPHASKSADRLGQLQAPQPQDFPRRALTKSKSTTTLAERRRVPDSPEKLKLYAEIARRTLADTSDDPATPMSAFERFEKENADLSPQASEDYILARLERQNALLHTDPKSVCIEMSRLEDEFRALRSQLQKEDDAMEWDFWECVVHDFGRAASQLPHLLAAKLRHGGIPAPVRGIVWRAMCFSPATNLESIYDKLVQEGIETSPYDRVIRRDLARTYPHVEMFKTDGGEGQQAMGRLLRAYSVYDAHVGYCQGLAFLVGPLLMTMPEKEAFCVFVRLMETYDMRTMFTLNMEGLHLRLHQFSVLLSQLCPKLDAHLAEHSIHPAMYASQWFLTLFAYTFPVSLVLRIYDLVFAEGAVETITRVAIAVMRKNEETLLGIDEFEKLMLYLSSRKLYEDAFDSDPEAVIAEAMDLSSVITKSKMDSIAQSHNKELEQEKSRAQQLLAIRFGGSSNSSTSKRSSKRESWFSRQRRDSSTTSPPSSPTVPRQDRSVQMLHQQIEDLVVALSQLQKEHSQLSEEMMNLKMREMDHETEKQKLEKRIAVLEKRVKKFKNKLAAATQMSPVSPVDNSKEVSRLQELERDPEFRSFVDSLRMNGDFGALIADALSSEGQQQQQQALSKVVVVESSTDEEEAPTTTIKEEEDSVMAAELDRYKLANFELAQKYDELAQKYEQLEQQLRTSQASQEELMAKTVELQNEVETLQAEKEQLLEERDELEQDNRDKEEKMMAAKKTSSELQLEKLELAKDVERLEQRVKELEDEKREYLMPRGSFTEEVLAAHQTLFGEKKNKQEVNRRHTLQCLPNGKQLVVNDEYQKKYIESELRCRELEKLLAESKYKLAEYEAAASPLPRVSLQHPPPHRRRSAVAAKRSSAASLSMMVGRMSLPASPSSFYEPRQSTDSLASNTSSKRSSMYSRIWNTFSTGQNKQSNEDLVTEEPQAI